MLLFPVFTERMVGFLLRLSLEVSGLGLKIDQKALAVVLGLSSCLLSLICISGGAISPLSISLALLSCVFELASAGDLEQLSKFVSVALFICVCV